ncbi:hypothetical protein MPTK2_8g18280 [Marchantia polymorpha subsp. ruderalis]
MLFDPINARRATNTMVNKQLEDGGSHLTPPYNLLIAGDKIDIRFLGRITDAMITIPPEVGFQFKGPPCLQSTVIPKSAFAFIVLIELLLEATVGAVSDGLLPGGLSMVNSRPMALKHFSNVRPLGRIVRAADGAVLSILASCPLALTAWSS